ncbi:HD domain-containing protein [Nonomuraea solani]|uniref:HD domain-containing protein n=1 Tax=Nonomuraea solani TaxID=1144553 RepID=A0A1H5V7H0_9ACTN|nr:HD domain-containing protein [Nonomuraea solani]SEF83352.1 HD domain-containing protein [Nonomuraea solani]
MSSSLDRRTLLGAGLAGAAGLTAASAPAAASAPDDLSFPATRVAKAARKLVADEKPYLRNHSLRSFLFARAVAAQVGRLPGRDYDAEVMFLICVLHDMGLTEHADTGQRFELDGADFAARFLERHGITDDRVDTVWDGIALHTSFGFNQSPVFARRRPPEIAIAQIGIGVDLTGGPGDLPDGYGERVHAAYPRHGGARALTDALVAQGLADPRKAPPMTLPGEILHQRHPEAPYITWEGFLAASGWDD